MVNHTAILGIITALGIPGPAEASPSLPARAGSAPLGALPRVQQCAPTRDEATSTDPSPVRPLASSTVAQRAASSDVPARPPVPFWREPRPAAFSPPHREASDGTAEDQSQEALDREEAKAAIERDGYKKVMVLDKASNGAWRAKAYRGVAEVFLTVGTDGTVSSE